MHERALWVVYKDYSTSLDELLEKDNSCKIHDRNLQKLVTEIFKVKMNLAPEIIKEVFEIVEYPYALRKELKLKSRKILSVRYGIETASFDGTRVWNSWPIDLRSKTGFLKTALANFVTLTSIESATCKLRTKCLIIYYNFFLWVLYLGVDLGPM